MVATNYYFDLIKHIRVMKDKPINLGLFARLLRPYCRTATIGGVLHISIKGSDKFVLIKEEKNISTGESHLVVTINQNKKILLFGITSNKQLAQKIFVNHYNLFVDA